jgi:hypothetical protein
LKVGNPCPLSSRWSTADPVFFGAGDRATCLIFSNSPLERTGGLPHT